MFRIGIVANEFFCEAFPPLGGFGLTVKTFSEFFQARPELDTEVVALLPQPAIEDPPERIHGTRYICAPDGLRFSRPRRFLKYASQLRKEQIDLLVVIDYYPGYFHRLVSLPRTPTVYMLLDPHPPEIWDRILTLQDGKYPCEYTDASRYRSDNFERLQTFDRLLGRPTVYTVPEDWLVERARNAFPLKDLTITPLINPIPVPDETVEKSERPSVIFLARLATVKRPWLFFEIAKRFPEVDFLVLGDLEPRRLLEEVLPSPGELPNVKHFGFLAGEEKEALLASSWMLVNTSIHEGMPNSVLEAMANRVPVVASLDFGGKLPEYGMFVGDHLGDGLDSLDDYSDAIRKLLDDAELRRKLGERGAEIVREGYSEEVLLSQFREIASKLSLDVWN